MKTITVSDEELELIKEGLSERFEVIEDGDWISEGKYENRKVVVKEISTGKFYMFCHSRSGSPFTDYDFMMDTSPAECEPVQVTKTIYKVIK